MIYLSVITVITIIILAVLLYRAIKLVKDKQVNLESLQANLDRTRTNLAVHEQKNDELHHELNRFRAEAGTLRNKVEILSQFQHILNIEQYVAERQNQVENFVEATKIEAESLLQGMKAYIEKVRHYLDSYEKNSKQKLEIEAREQLHGFYNQAMQQQNLTAISRALEHKINGYGSEYLFPAHTLLDELIDGYDHIDSALHLEEVRRKIKNAIDHHSVGDCDYVEEKRRLSAIALVTHVFNSKADLYLSRLQHDNLGELIQSLQDDFILINHYGAAFSYARIHESFLNLRLEELKFAALVLEFKEKQQQQQTQMQVHMMEG
ncbi:DUF4041 domain-containing protein [Acinetobacter sp. ANC 4277]|uniref:DUF4041 domain-containing protein n=1 Tax=Acinetobacter terrae TaxID=2731247 RepID=UPI00148FFECC|nr:DUF4041 domain-containing protein [Acinetobacter terrae]NNG74953.1 DUF4041 domain-containing protein [Acinetobacter terrae]